MARVGDFLRISRAKRGKYHGLVWFFGFLGENPRFRFLFCHLQSKYNWASVGGSTRFSSPLQDTLRIGVPIYPPIRLGGR